MLLLATYVGALVLGGGLLVVSALLGGHDHDADVDHDVELEAEVEADAELDADADADADHDGHVGVGDALWLPVLSIRFWTFFLAFFGLTGLSLEGLRHAGLIGAPWGVVLGLAIVTGVVSGWVVSRIVQQLKQEKVSSEVVPEHDYAGKAAEVLLDVAPGDPGLVRLEVKGVSIDVTAVVASSDVGPFKRGSKVIVLAYEQGKVRVAPFELGDDDARDRHAERRQQERA